jgi:hypothetical protein
MRFLSIPVRRDLLERYRSIPTQGPIMPMICFTCKAVGVPLWSKAVGSVGVKLFCGCSACRSVSYCSVVCQKKDWKQHNLICNYHNVIGGMAARQVRINGEDWEQFFKLFTESTLEGSQAAARKMQEIAARQTKHTQKGLLFRSLYCLVRADSEMLLWPNSPLLVLLQFVDPSVLSGHDHEPFQEELVRCTPLHHLAYLADPCDYYARENQVILGRQLIEHGANVNATTYVNAITRPYGSTPLHYACELGTTTRLDFMQLLLENGADPNARDSRGITPLADALDCRAPRQVGRAPDAAKFLIEWPTTDVNDIIPLRGLSMLARVRANINMIGELSGQNQLVLQQWSEVEEMLVERVIRYCRGRRNKRIRYTV